MAILEAASLKSRCPQGHALSEDWRLMPCLFQPLGVASHPWRSLASRQVHHSNFCLCLHITLSLYVSGSKFPSSYKDTSY